MGFVPYGQAVYEDTKPSVQAASTPVLREINSLCALPRPLLSASYYYCIIYCCSAAKFPDTAYQYLDT